MKIDTKRVLGLGVAGSVSALLVTTGASEWSSALGVGTVGGYAVASLVEAGVAYAYGVRRTILGASLALLATGASVAPILLDLANRDQVAITVNREVNSLTSQVNLLKVSQDALATAYAKTSKAATRTELQEVTERLLRLEATKGQVESTLKPVSPADWFRGGLMSLAMGLLLVVQGIGYHGSVSQPKRVPAPRKPRVTKAKTLTTRKPRVKKAD